MLELDGSRQPVEFGADQNQPRPCFPPRRTPGDPARAAAAGADSARLRPRLFQPARRLFCAWPRMTSLTAPSDLTGAPIPLWPAQHPAGRPGPAAGGNRGNSAHTPPELNRSPHENTNILDCIIIGGGPAGSLRRRHSRRIRPSRPGPGTRKISALSHRRIPAALHLPAPATARLD